MQYFGPFPFISILPEISFVLQTIESIRIYKK